MSPGQWRELEWLCVKLAGAMQSISVRSSDGRLELFPTVKLFQSRRPMGVRRQPPSVRPEDVACVPRAIWLEAPAVSRNAGHQPVLSRDAARSRTGAVAPRTGG